MILKQIDLVNFQTIKNFSQSLEGNVYFVTGENEVGKSTILKAIAILLTGNRDEILSLGEDKGFIKGIIGDDGKNYEVECRFTKKNPKGTLTIKDLESGMKSETISTLNDIFGYQNFDAQEFIQWSETAEGRRKQVEVVKFLLPETVQKRIIEIDKEVEDLKSSRKVDNAEFNMYSNVKKEKELGISTEDVLTFAAPLDVQELIEEQTLAIKVNEQIKGVEQRYNQRKIELEQIPVKIKAIADGVNNKIELLNNDEKELKEEFDRKLKAIEEKRRTALSEAEIEREKVDASKEELMTNIQKAEKYFKETKKIDLEPIQTKLNSVTIHNQKHQQVKELNAAKENLDKSQKKIDEKNAKLDKLSAEREKIIKESKLPVDGLSFTDDGLILNEIPFTAGNVSDSQIMEVVARLIMAKNPKVKLFRIGRGESLGAKRLKAIVDFAKKNGYQGFIEQVVRGQNELVVTEYSEK